MCVKEIKDDWLLINKENIDDNMLFYNDIKIVYISATISIYNNNTNRVYWCYNDSVYWYNNKLYYIALPYIDETRKVYITDIIILCILHI